MADHLSDDILSALLDAQVAPDQERAVQAHLAGCDACTRRLIELRSVVALVRGLPELEPPRDFALGPRLVEATAPSNVIRLERWYTWTRAAAASLAAVFVFLAGGTVYMDAARPATSQTAFESRASAPAPTLAPGNVPAPAPAPPQLAARSAAKEAAGATAQDASDQVKAATRVTALATPTSVPIAQPRPAARETDAVFDPAAPWRGAASVAGVLAALAVLGALVARHRVRRARAQLTRNQE